MFSPKGEARGVKSRIWGAIRAVSVSINNTMKNTSLRGYRGHGNECPLIEPRSRRTGSFLLSFCRITKAWCAFFVR